MRLNTSETDANKGIPPFINFGKIVYRRMKQCEIILCISIPKFYVALLTLLI